MRLPRQRGEGDARAENVATIGYPAYDSRIPDRDLMEQIFGGTYNKKRLAPGGVSLLDDTHILHDCTTLGGNSGSAVIDLESGQALGLHFRGRFLDANHAVREEFVFGPLPSTHLHVQTQTSIRSIEAKSGIGFGKLARLDPLADDRESLAAGGGQIASMSQIRFV